MDDIEGVQVAPKKRGRKKKESVDSASLEPTVEPISEIVEDPLIVDKILAYRLVKRKKEDEAEKPENSENAEAEKTGTGETEKKQEVPVKTDENSKSSTETGDEEEEYFIKWKGYSYIHCVWLFRDEIFDPRFDQKVRRYHAKLGTQMNAPDPDNEDIFNPEFVIIDRVLDMVEGTDPDSGVD